jgi:sugar O-acyltransferase (sialic acid O-acetyltransferase NeuD family)
MENCMKKFFIFGTKGFAKEVEFIIFDNFGHNTEVFFVAENGNENIGSKINNRDVISESEFSKLQEMKECFIAIGNPGIKKTIFEKFKNDKNIYFPNLIHRSVVLDSRYVKMGKGNIVCPNASITTNIEIGDFVHINLSCTIGHDTIIADYVTCSPGSNISGNVYIDEMSYLGTNCTIIEKITLAKNVVVGASCLVVRDLLEPGTYVGIPARKIK